MQYPGIFYANSETAIGQITDGTSNTFMIGERDGAPLGIDAGGTMRTRAASAWCGADRVAWLDTCLAPCSANPRWTIYSVAIGFKEQFVPITSSHAGGINFSRADGSVAFVPDTIDGTADEVLGMISDGMVVPEI